MDFSVTAYNRYGQPMAVEDKVLGTGQASLGDPLVRRFDARMTYDKLRRVIERKEGELSSPTAFASTSREQVLTRMLSGVAITDQVDLNGNASFTDLPPEIDNGEMDDSSRTFNKRNELTQRVVIDSTGTNTYDLTYDLNGNLTSDDEKYDYVYNPFGQLVQVKLVGTATVAANYTYNALGHRNSERTDTNDSTDNGIADGVVDGYDLVYFIATDLQGRRVATYRTTDADAKECFAYHAPSGSGQAGAMGPILRTRNSQEQNPVNWTKAAGSSTHDERYYYTSDFRGNVAAIVSSGGLFIEQYRYSATGVPMGIPRGDVNSDGQVVGATSGDPDYDESDYMDTNSVYGVRADWNLDGDIDGTDTAVVVAEDGAATARLTMSAPAVGNRHRHEWIVRMSLLGVSSNRSIAALTQPLSPLKGDPFDWICQPLSDGAMYCCPRDNGTRVRPERWLSQEAVPIPWPRWLPALPAIPAIPALGTAGCIVVGGVAAVGTFALGYWVGTGIRDEFVPDAPTYNPPPPMIWPGRSPLAIPNPPIRPFSPFKDEWFPRIIPIVVPLIVADLAACEYHFDRCREAPGWRPFNHCENCRGRCKLAGGVWPMDDTYCNYNLFPETEREWW